MATSSPIDPNGEAGAALRSAAEDYGMDVLTKARMLDNLFQDLLPDNRSAGRMLVRAAELDVPGRLQQHLGEGVDDNAAVRLTADSFATDSGMAPENSLWVVTQYAEALGRHPDPAVLAPPPPPPPPPPLPGPLPGLVPRPPPWPPPPKSKPKLKRRTLWAGVGGGVAVLVILGIIGALVPGPGPHPIPPTPTTTATRTTTAPPAPPTPLVALTTLMPDQNVSSGSLGLDVGTDCKGEPAFKGFVGVRSGLLCNVPGEASWALVGFQFVDTAHYRASLEQLLLHRSFDLATAQGRCPPPGVASNPNAQGSDTWSATRWPKVTGQDLYCDDLALSSSGRNPDYIWTLPKEDTLFELVGSTTTPFSAIESWWANDGAPG